MNRSWTTQLTGIAALLTLVSTTLNQLFDGDAATNPDWNIVVAGVMTALGLITARQNGKTSEDVGAK